MVCVLKAADQGGERNLNVSGASACKWTSDFKLKVTDSTFLVSRRKTLVIDEEKIKVNFRKVILAADFLEFFLVL